MPPDATEQTACDGCGTPLEPGDLRCSICGKAAPRQTTALQEVVVKILRCTGCGAAVAYDAKRQAPTCSFCDSVVKLETIEDPMEQTEGYLPFTVSKDQARDALQRWLGSLGWFRPSDLKSSARLEELRPLWWVAWVFDAESSISWAADSNAGSGRSDWAPHAGQTDFDFTRILASASRGLSGSEVDALAPGYSIRDAPPEPSGAENATLEQFDVQRSQARRQVNATLQGLAINHVQQNAIPGTRYRNVNVSVVVRNLVTRRLSFPAYVLAYRYKHQLYRVVICGQDQRLLIGKAPYSTAKIVLVAVGAIVTLMFLLGIFAAVAS